MNENFTDYQNNYNSDPPNYQASQTSALNGDINEMHNVNTVYNPQPGAPQANTQQVYRQQGNVQQSGTKPMYSQQSNVYQGNAQQVYSQQRSFQQMNTQQVPYSQRPFNVSGGNTYNHSYAPPGQNIPYSPLPQYIPPQNTQYIAQSSQNTAYSQPYTQQSRTYTQQSQPYTQPYARQTPLQNGYSTPYYYTPSKAELERESLRRSSSTAGKATLSIFLIMQGLGVLIIIIALMCGMMRYPISESDPYMGLSGWGFYLYEGMLSLVSIVIPCLIIGFCSKAPFDSLVPFKRVEGKYLTAIVIGGTAMCMIAQMVAALFGVNMSLFGIDIYANLDSESGVTLFDFLMSTLCTAIVPALVEELAFRGIVLGTMQKHGDLFAVLTSAFLFGMLHGNFVQIPFAFVVGLVLGYVRVKTGSMIPSILIHFCNNFFAVSVTVFAGHLSDQGGSIAEAMIMIMLIIAGFIAISYLAKNCPDFFTVHDGAEHALSFKERMTTFLSNGFIMADIIILSLCAFFLLVPTDSYV